MADKRGKDYPVGYGKPPQHTRFKKGRSGNPRGRPKGAKNVAALLEKALDTPVVVTDGGRRRKITLREAVLKQLVTKAASGDARHMRLLLEAVRASEARAEAAPGETGALGEADREVLERFLERIGARES